MTASQQKLSSFVLSNLQVTGHDLYKISAALNSQIFLQENSVVALIACGQEDSKCLERSCWMGWMVILFPLRAHFVTLSSTTLFLLIAKGLQLGMDLYNCRHSSSSLTEETFSA